MDHFVLQRAGWRLKAAHDLSSTSPDGFALLDGCRSVCALFADSISGGNWAQVKHAVYLVGLTAGFLRTQLTVLELAEQSEVADGATLLRKNIEALARIRELEATTDAERLYKRPPNVSALKGNARLLYGGYSEIAHSAHPRTAQLLGGPEDGAPGWVSLHPKFGEHTLVLISNSFVVLGEFYEWSRDIFPTMSDDYPLQEIDQMMNGLLATHDGVANQIEKMQELPD